ncbi:MAG: alpha/beta hydrolase [Ignavibacterium sp.]|jgi:pimeloyl-ACP methyl ester carboxylesterase|nr:alpha/beta hydrolase [Ignavibacterium sp.]
MKYLIKTFLFIFLSLQALAQQNLSGIWSGKLELPNSATLTIVFNLKVDSNGIYTTTLDSPDQQAFGIQTESTIIKEDSIFINIPVIKGTYKGKIIFEEKKIDGKWSQGGMNMDLKVTKTEKIEMPKRPQEPREPFPYNTEDVLFENEVDNVVLAGTLTFPKNGNLFPAVILITGSGGQNRDEEIFNHKPFLVIADYLTRNGIAVLRFDDRGVGQSTGKQENSTTEDFAKDVLAGVNFLKERKEIDKTKIGLIGHSEGGLIAPLAAVQSNDISFIILMAGPGVSGYSILALQNELIMRSEGASEDEIQKTLKAQQEVFSILKNSSKDNLEKELRDKLSIEYQSLTDDEKAKLGDSETYINMQTNILTSPWFKYFLNHDPASVLEKVNCPVLAINGENDLQVPPKENLSAIKKALEKGGNRNFEVIELKGLNHLFQTSETGKISEYGQIEETISPLALQTMLDWIKKVLK